MPNKMAKNLNKICSTNQRHDFVQNSENAPTPQTYMPISAIYFLMSPIHP